MDNAGVIKEIETIISSKYASKESTIKNLALAITQSEFAENAFVMRSSWLLKCKEHEQRLELERLCPNKELPHKDLMVELQEKMNEFVCSCQKRIEANSFNTLSAEINGDNMANDSVSNWTPTKHKKLSNASLELIENAIISRKTTATAIAQALGKVATGFNYILNKVHKERESMLSKILAEAQQELDNIEADDTIQLKKAQQDFLISHASQYYVPIKEYVKLKGLLVSPSYISPLFATQNVSRQRAKLAQEIAQQVAQEVEKIEKGFIEQNGGYYVALQKDIKGKKRYAICQGDRVLVTGLARQNAYYFLHQGEKSDNPELLYSALAHKLSALKKLSQQNDPFDVEML